MTTKNNPQLRATRRPISRRRFLQGMAVTTSGILVAGSSKLTTATTVDRVRRAPAQGSTITLSFVTSDAIDSPRYKAFQSLFADYEAANPTIKIEIQNIPNDQFMPTLTTRIVGNQAPDSAILLDRWVPALVGQDALLPLDSYLPADYGSGFNKVAWDFAITGGAANAIPFYTNAQANIYNVDQFAKAGITVPATPQEAWKWAEVVDVARKVKEANSIDFGLIHWPASTPARLSIYLVAAGGSILNAERTAPALNSPVAIELLTQIQETFKTGLSPQDNWTQAASANMFPLFANGKASMLIASGNFQVAQAADLIKDSFKWSFFYMPATLGTPILLSGFKQTKYPEEVAKLLQWMAGEENMVRYATQTNSLPTRKNIPAEALSYAAGNEQMKIVLKQLEVASPVIQAEMRHPAWSEIDLMLRAKLEQLALGQATPQQVAETGSAEIEQLLARYA